MSSDAVEAREGLHCWIFFNEVLKADVILHESDFGKNENREDIEKYSNRVEEK